MLGGKWSWRNEGFEGKKRGGRPKVLNNAGKIVLRRLDTKKETSPQGNSHIVSKLSPERVMKSCLKCLKN